MNRFIRRLLLAPAGAFAEPCALARPPRQAASEATVWTTRGALAKTQIIAVPNPSSGLLLLPDFLLAPILSAFLVPTPTSNSVQYLQASQPISQIECITGHTGG
jgi:hypothetical protein